MAQQLEKKAQEKKFNFKPARSLPSGHSFRISVLNGIKEEFRINTGDQREDLLHYRNWMFTEDESFGILRTNMIALEELAEFADQANGHLRLVFKAKPVVKSARKDVEDAWAHFMESRKLLKDARKKLENAKLGWDNK